MIKRLTAGMICLLLAFLMLTLGITKVSIVSSGSSITVYPAIGMALFGGLLILRSLWATVQPEA